MVEFVVEEQFVEVVPVVVPLGPLEVAEPLPTVPVVGVV
jgi:hypothetical protein